MVLHDPRTLARLYESDETAWLELMAGLVREGRSAELDMENLSEFLESMARRDRREVESRLAVLIAHLLKWMALPDRRGGSWKATIEVQRQELAGLLQSGTLHQHAETTLPDVYHRAVRQAVAETGLPGETFPPECPYSLEQLLDDPDTITSP